MTTAGAQIPTTRRLAPKKILVVVAIAAAMLFGMVVMGLIQRQQTTQQPPPPTLPPLYEVQGEADMLQQLQLKKDWAGVDRTPPKPSPTPPAATPPPPMFAPQAPVPPPTFTPVASVPPAVPPIVATLPQTVQPTPQPVTPVAPTKQAPTAKKEDEDWLFAPIKREGKGRQGGNASNGQEGGQNRGRGTQSALFPMAQWETPAQPLKVIYQSQLLHAIVEGGIVSGEDADVRLKLVETLFDKFAQQTVLLPLGTMPARQSPGNRQAWTELHRHRSLQS